MRAILIALAVLLAGCADRDGSIEAARRLAESNYPGQLELHDTQLQKDHYDIIFAVKGDPITRIRFGVDRDPEACQPGTPCEERLRRAYRLGIASGARLKALNQVFRTCGVPLLAVEGASMRSSRMVVELDLGETDQQPALDRLGDCARKFRAISGDRDAVWFSILRPGPKGAAAMPDLVTFETRMPRDRRDEPRYLVAALADQDRIAHDTLRIDTSYVRRGPIAEPLETAVRSFLSSRLPNAELRSPALYWGIKLDPRRLDVIRAYVLACSRPAPPGKGLCKDDLAIPVTFDMRSGEASGMSVLPISRQKGEPLRLPELPGR